MTDARHVKDVLHHVALCGNVLNVDAPLPEFEELPGEQHSIVLTARAQSQIYIGQVTLFVRMDTVDLSSVITVEDLSGLTYVAPPPP